MTLNLQQDKKLEELIRNYDSIVSKDTNDIDTTPLIVMEIKTEGPPCIISTLCIVPETSGICA